MPKNVILVHGYSVRSLDTYGMLPNLLQTHGFLATDIYLSAFDTLNDDVTCSDLANALEIKLRVLIETGLDLNDTAIITHSTGAIIVRRWLLNRWAAKLPLPSHFISLAGANQGSSLAQLGASALAHLFRFVDGGTSVGAEVLQDLDYGSSFLLTLNEDWLDAYRSPLPPRTYSFSLGGDDHSDLEDQLFWQTRENGCDSTVRVSGANLNYQIASIDQTSPNPVLLVKSLSSKVPHLVLHGVSHTGDKGILGGNAATMQIVYPFVQAALSVTTQDAYTGLATSWEAQTKTWSNQFPTQCNATIVFSLSHPGGRAVEDSLILILDQSAGASVTQRALNVSGAIELNQPIRNATTASSVAFYVNYPAFIESYPHTVRIQINSGCDEIQYPVAEFQVLKGMPGSIRPNETIYVKVTLDRLAGGTYSLIPVDQNPNLTKQWPPLPQPLPAA